MELICIRHGQTTGDVEERYGGMYDDHLSSLGIDQVKLLRTELVDVPCDLIVTSPLMRAHETATIFSGGEIAIEIEDDLRERNQYGILSGMQKWRACIEYPDAVELLKDKMNTIDGAESYQDFSKRLQEVFERITHLDKERIAIVWHGGPMRVLFREILKKGEIAFEDCAWVRMVRTNDVWEVIDSRRITFRF